MDIKSAVITAIALVLTNTADASTIVINEFLPNPVGTDSGKEWIELFNDDTQTISIGGWAIQRATSSFTTVYTFPIGTALLSGEYFIVGGASVTAADLNTTQLGFGNASSSGDAVRLIDELSNVIDTVIYGPNNNDGFLNDFGTLATTIAITPLAGQSLGRVIDGLDTQISGNDFSVFDNPSFGASNNISAVPVPASAWLFISGLLGMTGISRRRNRA